jgi:Flp pilus assembly CpaF family ATPase
MAKEMDSAQILRHLEEDMGDLLGLFQLENVFEVMLNPYKRDDGLYEGHIWYEQAGKGMLRLIKSKTIPLVRYSTPIVGDKVFYRYVDENNERRIINYHVLTDEIGKERLESIGVVLKNSILIDEKNNDYLEQEEHYKLNVLADNISERGVFYHKKPIQESEINNIFKLVDDINAELQQLIGISFKVGMLEINDDSQLKQFNKNPQYIITKEFVKMTESKAEQIMGILAAANSLHFHSKEPRLECSIPFYHHRFTGQRTPIVKFPSFTIRKHSSRVIPLEEYVEMGVIPDYCAETIRDWIKRGYNILVAGGTGSGKTTLLNALVLELARIHPQVRAAIIEDTPEVQCSIENSVSFVKSKEVSIDDLLVTTLRMRPDSIMVGEVRSREAYTLFKAMLTGHKNCFGTIHANGAYEATFRYEQCIREHPDCANMPVPREQIALALNAVISIQRTTVRIFKNGYYENVVQRKVTALREITNYDPKYDKYEDVMFYQDKEAILEDTKPVNNTLMKYQ